MSTPRTLTSTCGRRVITDAEVGERPAGLRDPGREHQPGEHAVAGGAVVEHDDVPGLLAAERVPAGAHLLEDVAVADRGLPHRDALALHRLEQPEVAHHGGDEGVVGQHGPLPHRDGEDRP